MDNEDDEILKTVRSMLGANVEIIDCEKTSTVHEEEVLLINGIPIKLDGANGDAVKKALITGEMPPCDLLNEILFQAGVLRKPVHLETSLSIKTSQITKEEVIVARGGRIIDERSTETQEDNVYTSSCQETWEPVHLTVPSNQTATDTLSADCPTIFCGSSGGKKKTPLNEMRELRREGTSSSSLSNNIEGHCVSNSKPSINSSTNSSSSSVLSSASSLNQKCVPSSSTSAHGYAGIPKTTKINATDEAVAKFGISKNHSLKTLQSISCDSGHHDSNDDDTSENFQQQRTPNSISSNGCYDFSDDDYAVGNDETDFVGKRLANKRLQSSPVYSRNLVYMKPQKDFVRVCIYL